MSRSVNCEYIPAELRGVTIARRTPLKAESTAESLRRALEAPSAVLFFEMAPPHASARGQPRLALKWRDSIGRAICS